MSNRDVSNLSFQVAHAEFQKAWNKPTNTRFDLPTVDVNKLLRERYRVVPDRPVTRAEMWDMEVKKAWDPLNYIPYVVSEGGSWGRRRLADGSERVNHDSETILFMGRDQIRKDDGTDPRASDFQSLFHVVHGVGGTDSRPENLWRIVLLTEHKDRRFHEPFEAMAKAGWLPGFIEIYLQHDLGMTLARR